jgi:lipopolysaccharide export LptBFGC system permease protein LptF
MKQLKTLIVPVMLLALLTAGIAAAQNKFHAPQSVLHVVTVKWKADATDAQKQAALDGVKTMAGKVKGITNVWLKTEKVQPSDYNAVIAIEFKDAAAFKAYADDPAHKEWEKLYLPIRQQSTTHDVTN